MEQEQKLWEALDAGDVRRVSALLHGTRDDEDLPDEAYDADDFRDNYFTR